MSPGAASRGRDSEQMVIRPQSRLLDPLLDSVARCGRDLELNRALSLVLHDDGPRCHLVTVADVPDLEAESVPRSVDATKHDERYPRTAGSVACDEPGTGRRWVTRCLASTRPCSLDSISVRQRRSNSAGAMLPSDEWRRSVL